MINAQESNKSLEKDKNDSLAKYAINREWASNLINDLEKAYSDREFTPINHPERQAILDRLDHARIQILRALVVLEMASPDLDEALHLLSLSDEDGEQNIYLAGMILVHLRNLVGDIKKTGKP